MSAYPSNGSPPGYGDDGGFGGGDGNGHAGGGAMPGGLLAPPHSLEAEQSVLGAILLSDRVMFALVIEEGLKPEDFYREKHRLVYGAMLELYEQSEPIDVLTVADLLRGQGKLDEAGGQATIDGLAAAVPAAGHARRYARIVREHALMRRLLSTTYEIQSSVASAGAPPREIVERAERAMLEVAHDDRQKDFRSVEEVLHDELDKLHRLSLQGTALTGTPSGFKDLDELTGGFQPGNLVIIAARPSMGKCLSGHSLIYDPTTGARRKVSDVVAGVERGEETWVASVTPDLAVMPAKVTAAHRNGRRAVFRLRTRLGRRVEATANHPLLTLDGWRRMDELEPGARIAVPRHLPRYEQQRHLRDAELVLLAALIADGDLGGSTPRFTAAKDTTVLREVVLAAEVLGARVSRYPAKPHIAQLGLCAPARSASNPVTELCREHGLMGTRSRDKFVPDAVFAVPDLQIRRFLGVLFACDGHIHVSDRIQQVGYSTTSERLARDVQHLLLRLGIISTIRTLRRAVYEGTETVAREVRITHQESVGAFCELVPVPGKEEQQRAALALLRTRRSKTNTDTVPPAVWERIATAKGERSWAALSRDAGYPPGHNWHAGTRGVSRPRLAQLAELVDDAELGDVATSDLWWDEVASVEPAGEEETYDLTVPLHHNFVADDIVVHNSALVTNMAENAAIEHNAPVALFSLEMSETELAQRFVASQARIKGEELRKGRVAEHKWAKIIEASQRLAKAPLYIDDSSDAGLLEIRAKARRLHQQHGLGLIIIDYLQLMRADGRTENRVEQIGQMSRGLKILARAGAATEVTALDTGRWRLGEHTATNAFSTGVKPVLRLTLRSGRTVRATGNHRFLTLGGWRRLDELDEGARLATPRRAPSGEGTMSSAELALLGHLIGDGCTLPRQPIHYTTVDEQVAEHVAALAVEVFGDAVRPRVCRERTWFQVYLAATAHLTRGVRNPVAAWLDRLGVFGLRSHEKHVPDAVFGQLQEGIATFLRHLWATDGSLWFSDRDRRSRIYYATSSERLARDVQSLLLRCDVRAGLRRVEQRRGRPQWHVDVRGAEDVCAFLDTVGAFGGQRTGAAARIAEATATTKPNTNRDVVPREAWETLVKPAMAAAGVTSRQMQAAIGTAYCGSTIYRRAMSRRRAAHVAAAVHSDELARLAESDVYWDEVVSIVPDGEEEVFDLTVPGPHNFVANDIVVHNSIEQDADLVAFIYRDEYYDKESEREGEADIIIAKHRNGAIGEVTLTFQKEYPKFLNFAGERYQ